MRFIRRLLLLRWPQTRILRAQRAGDDGQFGQTMIVPGGQHHPAQTRVQRQTCQIASEAR